MIISGDLHLPFAHQQIAVARLAGIQGTSRDDGRALLRDIVRGLIGRFSLLVRDLGRLGGVLTHTIYIGRDGVAHLRPDVLHTRQSFDFAADVLPRILAARQRHFTVGQNDAPRTDNVAVVREHLKALATAERLVLAVAQSATVRGYRRRPCRGDVSVRLAAATTAEFLIRRWKFVPVRGQALTASAVLHLTIYRI